MRHSRRNVTFTQNPNFESTPFLFIFIKARFPLVFWFVQLIPMRGAVIALLEDDWWSWYLVRSNLQLQSSSVENELVGNFHKRLKRCMEMTVTRRTVTRWTSRITGARSGKKQTSQSSHHLQGVHNMLLAEKCITVKELSLQVGTEEASVCKLRNRFAKRGLKMMTPWWRLLNSDSDVLVDFYRARIQALVKGGSWTEIVWKRDILFLKNVSTYCKTSKDVE